MGGLTKKQEKWLATYLECWNGAEASRQAGYKSVYQSAHDNLTNPKIQEVIALRLSLHAMTADEALSRLGDHARATVEDFIKFDSGATGIWRIDLQKALGSGKLHIIKKIWYDKDNHAHLELHDSQRALELILKAHGAFKERIEHSGPGGRPIGVTIELTDDERAAGIDAILDAARARRDRQASDARMAQHQAGLPDTA